MLECDDKLPHFKQERMKRMKNTWLSIFGALAMLLPSAAARADQPEDGPVPAVEFHAPTVVMQTIKPSAYWLGVELFPVDAAIRAQLDLPKDTGLLVQRVLPDGPAAKAGIKVYDVLLRADGKPLEKIQDMIAALDKVREGTLKVELLRAGKKQTVDLKPVKRPENIGAAEQAMPQDGDMATIEKFLEGVAPGARPWARDQDHPLFLYSFHPGAMLPHHGTLQLPENMSITIVREGKKPAQITVKQGDETWKVGENELAKLPDKVRPLAEQMLHGTPLWLPNAGAAVTVPPPLPGIHGQAAPSSDVDRRLEEMNRQIEELHKSLDRLHQNPGATSPEKRQDKAPAKPSGDNVDHA
jgi:hypothetical protein